MEDEGSSIDRCDAISGQDPLCIRKRAASGKEAADSSNGQSLASLKRLREGIQPFGSWLPVLGADSFWPAAGATLRAPKAAHTLHGTHGKQSGGQMNSFNLPLLRVISRLATSKNRRPSRPSSIFWDSLRIYGGVCLTRL